MTDEYDFDVETIDQAYTYDGWIEILTIFKDASRKSNCHFDAEHEVLYMPEGVDIDPESEKGMRLQQLGCFYDGDLERWARNI